MCVREPLIPRLVARAVGWAAGVFMVIERTGPELPPGPVLVVANHPNSLLDPLLVFRTAGRPARPLAKAPLFEQAFTGSFLRALGGLPVYRRQDHPDLMHLNETTFDAAIGALTAGDAVQIYPEGTTHSEPSLAPLRTGAARIALLSEERAGWRLGLQIAPVGLTYERKTLFRGLGLAAYGSSFPVLAYREAYERDPQTAVRALTEDIAAALMALTLNFAESGDSRLVAAAERLYAAEKGWTSPRQREDMARRMPRLQSMAQGFAWLRAQDPGRHQQLSERVARYSRKARALGAEEGDVPSQYRIRAVCRYLLIDALPFGLGLPLAAAGTAVWLPVIYMPRLLVRVAKPKFEAISSYKLSAAFVWAPVTYAAWLVLAWRVGGTYGLVAAALLLPALGLIAVGWRDRWARIRGDVRLFRLAMANPSRMAVLTQWRRDLAREFDQVGHEMVADGAIPQPQTPVEPTRARHSES